MTDSADLPSPAGALEAAFRAILRRQMHGMPMVNPALSVEAVGFRPWADHWLGILITPWFMNLVLMPRVRAKWHAVGVRETRPYVFPAGVFDFIGNHDPAVGDYQACSLFSPMFDFDDHPAAHAIGLAALDALFDAANRKAVAAPTPMPRPVSKRDFLFGSAPRADHGP